MAGKWMKKGLLNQMLSQCLSPKLESKNWGKILKMTNKNRAREQERDGWCRFGQVYMSRVWYRGGFETEKKTLFSVSIEWFDVFFPQSLKKWYETKWNEYIWLCVCVPAFDPFRWLSSLFVASSFSWIIN